MRFSVPPNILLIFSLLLSPEAVLSAGERSLHHDLRVTLVPEEHRLLGMDTVFIEGDDPSSLVVSLSEEASVKEVLFQGSPCSFTFASGRLRVPLNGKELRGDSSFRITYSVIFHDPPPEPFMSTDNPGCGVTGIISEKVTFLQSGAGWYPEIKGSHPTFYLRVTAPAGILAVTAGELMGHDAEDEKTNSTWRIRHPIEGLSLSAGPYLLRTKQAGRVTAMTYFTAENQFLSQPYLDAASRYLGYYEEHAIPLHL